MISSRVATTLLRRSGRFVTTTPSSFLSLSTVNSNNVVVPVTTSSLASSSSSSLSSSVMVVPCFRRSLSSSSSSSSHDDFAPKRKVVDGQDEALKLIQEHVDGNPVMLYMKGNPSMPMCGFSARVVQVLKTEGVDFASVNVLDYPDIREGVKKFSDWPTIPQLYVNGEFIGGCDIVTQMHESGELKDLLSEAKEKEP